MRRDLEDLDRQAADEHRRDRDRHREPRWSRRQLRLQRRWAVQTGLLDRQNELAAAGVLQPPIKPDGDS